MNALGASPKLVQIMGLMRLFCGTNWRMTMALGWLGYACAAPAPTSRRPVTYFEPSDSKQAAGLEEAHAAEANPPLGPVGCGESRGQLFDGNAPWNTPITSATLAADSAAVVQFLERSHRSTQRFRIDFSFAVLTARASEPLRPFTPNDAHYLPDCDTDPMPVPATGRIEGEEGFQCTQDGDCHLLVHVPETCQLYEMHRANITSAGFAGGCQVHWDTRMQFGIEGRGFDCTSADASGLPITPLLFSPADIASGRISHALRLVLPNSLIRHRAYVPPASHSTGPTSGPGDAPAYGSRFRLRADYDPSRLSGGAQVVARALQEYGMILVDGGSVSFTTLSDRESPLKWDEVQFGARSLESLRWTDFELVQAAAAPRVWRGECTRVQQSLPSL